MPWKKASEVLVGSDGEVHTADVGTTLPTTAPTRVGQGLNAAFIGHGFHAESGLTVARNFEEQEFRAWQALRAIRRERQTEDLTLTFDLLQWNEETVPLAFGGGEITSDGGSGYLYSPPQDADAVDERSLVADIADGTRLARIVIPRGSVVEGTESQFQRTDMATLRIVFRTLEPDAGGNAWYALFNDAAAFAAGS